MPASIRHVTPADMPQLVGLLLDDARARSSQDPALWTLLTDAPAQVEEALRFAMTAERQPFRQAWLVAEIGDRLVGVIHSARLLVPPIYAGPWGDPGLLMPEWRVSADAPAGTMEALLEAAEADLRGVGADLLLASVVDEDDHRALLAARGYQPLTLYISKSGLEGASSGEEVRPATEGDIEGIVRLSAENRRVLFALDPFWTPHPEADARFGGWMRKSLLLADRDMLVTGPPGDLHGYVVAQPASRLHFPPAHDIASVGVIDDFVHHDFLGADELRGGGEGASALLAAAEMAFARRGVGTAFIVCPAAWTAKIALLENAGYHTAMTWMIKR